MKKVINLLFVLCFTLHYVKSTTEGLSLGKMKRVLTNPFIKSSQEMVLRTGLPETTTNGVVKKNCVCSKIYDPVCASNGKSYYNQCQMQCEAPPGSVTVVHMGNCIPY